MPPGTGATPDRLYQVDRGCHQGIPLSVVHGPQMPSILFSKFQKQFSCLQNFLEQRGEDFDDNAAFSELVWVAVVLSAHFKICEKVAVSKESVHCRS